MLAPVTHILPVATIRRERILPVPGRLVVRKGQKVGCTDVVAEAQISPRHLMLNVARGLGLSKEKADGTIQVKAGERVASGDVLAGPIGITKRVVRSPRDGRVIVVGDGQVLLEVVTSPYELKAGLPGIVTALLEDKGVVVETTGALVQGVWGNGYIDYGLMFVLIGSPDDILEAHSLDVSLRGSVVLGGHCNDPQVFSAAADLPLRGLILASMEPSLLPVAAGIRVPVMVTEGFGQLPMNLPAFRLLSTYDQREVAVNASRWDRFTGSRPEVIVPLPASGDTPLPPDTNQFSAGQLVRIVRAPYASNIGTITDLLRGKTRLDSGLLAPAAEVQLGEGESVVVPLANLEVLE